MFVHGMFIMIKTVSNNTPFWNNKKRIGVLHNNDVVFVIKTKERQFTEVVSKFGFGYIWTGNLKNVL